MSSTWFIFHSFKQAEKQRQKQNFHIRLLRKSFKSVCLFLCDFKKKDRKDEVDKGLHFFSENGGGPFLRFKTAAQLAKLAANA